jgi:hypothetical protein
MVRMIFFLALSVALLLSSSQSYGSVNSSKVVNQAAEQVPTQEIELLDIQTVPSVVKVGQTFEIKATVVNNSLETITYQGLCESPLSAVFDMNVRIEQLPACAGLSTHELHSGERITMLGPGPGIVYQATASGVTSAEVSFTYMLQKNSITVSKPFEFTILEPEDLVRAELGNEFQLRIDQTALIESANVMVKLNAVTEDSRCPGDVVCIWMGQVTILVNVFKDAQFLSAFTLTSNAGDVASATKTFDSFSVTLVKVEPYPVSSGEIKSSDYISTLVVSEKESMQENSGRVYIKGTLSEDNVAVDTAFVKVFATWNLVQSKGAVIMVSNDGLRRDILRFTPSVANCESAADECIDGWFLSSILARYRQDSKIHLEVDKANMKLLMRQFDKTSEGSEISYTVKKIKTWSIDVGTGSSVVVLGEGQRNANLLVQKIYPDHIEGLNFVEYPLAREDGIPITLNIGESASNGCTVKFTLLDINESMTTFLKIIDTNRICPL